MLYRVGHVETTKNQEEIESLLSGCGQICDIYPWRTRESPANTHFFVVFKDQASLKRARALQIPGTKIHVLACSPQLIPQFDALVSQRNELFPASSELSPSSSIRVHAPPRQHRSAQGRPSGSRSLRKADKKASLSSFSDAIHYSPARGYSDWPMGATATAESDGSFAVPGLPHTELAYPSSYAQAFAYDSQCTPMDTSGSESFIQHSAAQSSLAHASPTRPLGIVSQSISHTPEGHSLAATIPTPQSILPSCNIKQLNDDSESLPANPDDAISFLVDTASNALSRGKWMVLAGQYRMNGNTEAAIAVLSAMIHVMISPTVGLPEGELKPIFLMLSSCHTEIWKRIRVNGRSEISKMHFEKAKAYLQAVYGTNTPQLSAPSELLRVRSKSGLNSKYIRESTDSFNMKEQVPQVESPSDSGHIKSLEKEIDTLRDRQSTQKTCLAQVRGAKRKLEEDLSLEKRSRRKFERELDRVVQELSGARRGEKHALEQCRREVENRRNAEERVVVLKEEIKEVRRSAAEFEDAALLRDRRSREIFGAVGIACMRAAKGEFIWETSASGNGSNAHEE